MWPGLNVSFEQKTCHVSSKPSYSPSLRGCLLWIQMGVLNSHSGSCVPQDLSEDVITSRVQLDLSKDR